MPAWEAEFGRISWKRFAIVLIPSLIVAALMLFAVGSGAVATSFNVSGNLFKVSVGELDGTGNVQFLGVDQDKNGTRHPVLVTAFRHANIANLCQSAKVGPVVLRLTAGGGSHKISASNLVLHIDSLTGDGTFTNIEIGRDASTLNNGPQGLVGSPGTFGQQNTAVHLTNIRQSVWSSTAGSFTLPGLSLGFGGECF